MVVVKKQDTAPYGYVITDGANSYALTERVGKEGTGDFCKVKLPSWCGHKMIHMDKIRTVTSEADIETLYNVSTTRTPKATSSKNEYDNMRSAINAVREIVKCATEAELAEAYTLDTVCDTLGAIVDRYENTSKQETAVNTLSGLLSSGLSKDQLTALLETLTATATAKKTK